jgi:uncharacterized protein (DUF1501 family)
MTKLSRRDLLSLGGCAALGLFARSAAASRLSTMTALAEALAPSDYRALVAVFLAGGNDANNMVVPVTGYAAYSAVRSAAGLAIPQAQLLSVTPPAMGGAVFGLHPELSELHGLWGQGKAAVVCNVGTLVEPLPTRADYLNAARKKPYQLFSHSDQQGIWQTARADTRVQTGWGGRLADALACANPGALLPMPISVAGINVFAQGVSTRPLAIPDSGTALNNVFVLSGYASNAESIARRNAFDAIRGQDPDLPLVASAAGTVQQALDIGALFGTDPVLSPDRFAGLNTSISRQLKQVAKLVKLNRDSAGLGLNRQVFFVQQGGYDTHQNQISEQAALFDGLSQALAAFQITMEDLGYGDRVTAFTLSDFGRTLQPAGSGSGSVGTDHAWGSHQLVVGGAVKGGNFYGAAGPNGTIFPSLVLGNAAGSSDTDTRGRFIPTVAVDQYGATLARWFGVSDANLPAVFPNLSRFAPEDLGFLNPPGTSLPGCP